MALIPLDVLGPGLEQKYRRQEFREVGKLWTASEATDQSSKISDFPSIGSSSGDVQVLLL